ncbi:MAG: YlxR family protein [Actinobacteria bacterium]|nr:YlxR family protein [Actinomycetota bacterium]
MEPVRTCLGCRQRADASSLLRVVASGGEANAVREVWPDPSAVLPGRGAWVHPVVSCLDKATQRRAFGRALRVTEALDTTRLYGIVNSSTVTNQPTG